MANLCEAKVRPQSSQRRTRLGRKLLQGKLERGLGLLKLRPSRGGTKVVEASIVLRQTQERIGQGNMSSRGKLMGGQS